MGHKIVNLVSTLRPVIIAGTKIEGKFWRQFWKHPYDKFIRASITAGQVATQYVYNQDDTLVSNGEVPQKYGPKAGKQNQARSRFKRNSCRCNSAKHKFMSGNRYSNTGKYRKYRNRR